MLLFNNYLITNIRDFYVHFDVEQALEQEDEVLNFAEKNLLCIQSSSVNAYCCYALRRAQKERLPAQPFADSFWHLGGTVIPEFNLLNELFDWFCNNQRDEGWFSLYVKTAALLFLGKQNIDEYVAHLYSKPKSLISCKSVQTDYQSNLEKGDRCSNETTVKANDEHFNQSKNHRKVNIENIPTSSQVKLGYRAITGSSYTYYYYPQLKLNAKETIRTVELCAIEDDITITFIPIPADAGVEFTEKIPAESSIFVNAIGCNIVSVLKNQASFEQITLRREKGGIYAYDREKRLGNEPRLPSSVSSFAVLGREAYLYIEDGELKYTPNVSSVNNVWYSMADIFVEVGNDGNGAAVILDDRGRVYSYSVKTAEKITSLSQLLN